MNKTTKHYFTSLFKRKIKLLGIYTAICFMGYPFLEIASILSLDSAYELNSITQISFVLALITLGILSAVLPIFTFKFAHTKKHVDTYFSIPLNRNHLFKSHFIAPIIGVCIPLLINYLIGGLIFVLYTGQYEMYLGLLILLLLAFVMFACVYSFNTFFVLNCNNVLDSSIITVAIAGLPLVFSSAINWFLDAQVAPTGMIEVYDIYTILLKVFSPYAAFVELGGGLSEDINRKLILDFTEISFNYLFYYLIIGIVCFFLSKKVFKKKKGENAEQLSTSFVTYPLLINVGLVSSVLIFNHLNMEIIPYIIVAILILVAYILASSIAARSVQFNLKMVIKFVVLIGLVCTFNVISRETEFFGINRKTVDYSNYKDIQFNYFSYRDKFDENEEPIELIVKIDGTKASEAEKAFFDFVEELQKDRSLRFQASGDVWLDESYANLSIDYRGYADRYVNYSLSEDEEIKLLDIYNRIMNE